MLRQIHWVFLSASLTLSHFAFAAETNYAEKAKLFDQGNALYKQSKWKEAKDKFDAVWQIEKTYDVAANLADCELYLGNPLKAARYFRFALDHFPPSAKQTQLERITARFEEAKSQIGTLIITTSPIDAKISIDNIDVTIDNNELYASVGQHKISAHRDGFEDEIREVTLQAGKRESLQITLTPLISKTASNPPSTTPTASSKVSPLVVVGGALFSAAAITTGIVTTQFANKKSEDADQTLAEISSQGQKCPESMSCSELQQQLQAADDFSNTAVLSFVLGGVTAIATAAYVFWPRQSDASKTSLNVSPYFTETQFGLGFGGAF